MITPVFLATDGLYPSASSFCRATLGYEFFISISLKLGSAQEPEIDEHKIITVTVKINNRMWSQTLPFNLRLLKNLSIDIVAIKTAVNVTAKCCRSFIDNTIVLCKQINNKEKE